MRAAKVCSHPDCANPQPCSIEGHEAKPWEQSTRRKRLPKGWAKKRSFVLTRDPTCKICSEAPSTEADHINRGDDHSYSNLQGVCKSCHKTKTAAEAAQARGVGGYPRP